ncbi:MAG: hypothetical protein UX08_C0012G0021 [Candidatus Collierbacteria bacterium GW2011_GWB1_45_35]|uniref:Uncharacterized protein n=1 Tax=Candidatus Collierbacteria bacterium GW2011_GWB2_45_17 TaxID=1618388 RepID=A0A837IK93_9BACT|nr:MAG: hypothetical protein UW48_C0001G0126 [Microgenomates group bacterium GW2011_GWC1_44_23]KKT96246.1 MAG: hypothetical protein UW96_C0001G0124 [Candidatus Collierbacteria bacterium GW2011_GWA1_45_15]KKU01286.1 MAG: hypothetical protein UX01_C0001G0130 [Candidatus Collierbacteria bacterium GW2011_GWB2_45_17]KKU04988.1 MAG: hypothetical protein UX08_C0012G0021 [Candidatus Collierbacteria bacterium GW2011_GWB1_45_35]HBC44992.1 hypothetical protein [Candidatus Collierbacteria bacterium]
MSGFSGQSIIDEKSHKVRQYIFALIWIVILIHFLKDITQDILNIPTFLDAFGNIQEDVSWLPIWAQSLVYGTGVSSFLAEIFLLISIPIIKKREKGSNLEKWVIGVVIFMLIYFPVVIFLDPRY